MQKVALDSSFLMAVAERPTPWLDDLTDALGKVEPVLLDCVGGELRRLSATGGRKGKMARLALQLAAEFGTAKCGGGDVDAELASFAEAHRAVVATVDASLRAQLRARGLRVASLSKGRVAVD